MRYSTKFFYLLIFILLCGNTLAVSNPRVKFATVIFPGGQVFHLEVASTPEQWIKGLMYRKSLPENSGMLFLYPKEDYYAIWMKNCLIPLDIIWLDSKGRIIYFIENALPCKEEPCTVYEPIMKARYVIELKGGTIKKINLKTGKRIAIVLPEK